MPLAGLTEMKPWTYFWIIVLCKPWTIATYSLGLVYSSRWLLKAGGQMMMQGEKVYLRPFKAAMRLSFWNGAIPLPRPGWLCPVPGPGPGQAGRRQYQCRPYSYAICKNGSDRPIGLIELYQRDLVSMEVGFLLDEKQRGRAT